MNTVLITQLSILKMSRTKPNYAELARMYDLDRRTVKKYYDGYDGKPRRRNKANRLDKHLPFITIRGVTVRAVYEYFHDEVDSSIGTYSNFNKNVKAKGLKLKKTEKGYPRYETEAKLFAVS
ncbi:MAG: hypothetical protein Q4D21_03705 [Phascolarctobacterium sp.]|nr:hypothetical protein [Phascolarctobacterium sp.]